MQSKQPCKKKTVSSELFLAAETRLEPSKRGNSEGTWSLFSGTEAQDYLYVTAIFFFMLFLPYNLQQRRKIRFSSKNSIKTVTLPGNDAKNWLLKWKNNQRVKNLPCSLWLTGRVHEEECDRSFLVNRLKTKNCVRFLMEKRMKRKRWLNEKLQL